ncbi:MAG: hypothetical protein KDC06_11375 [Chitinophagaceae bacterium]|nr:hypothetical protein [Chitinophagaceae bacterium]
MKKIFLIILIAALTKTTQAQVPDTLAYLQSIELNKANYIGQPFSVLFNNLQIQTKYFYSYANIHYDKNKETATKFAFYFPQTAEDLYMTSPSLKIYWQTPLNANQSGLLWGNNDGGGWNTNVYNFYKNAIIKDIQVRD